MTPLGLALAAVALATIGASSAAVAADLSSDARLESALTSSCPEYRAASSSSTPRGWTCWAPGANNPDAQGNVPAVSSDATSTVHTDAVQSPFLWSFSATAYYGVTSHQIGSVQVSAQVSQNGRQSRNSESLQTVTGPAIRQLLYIDCFYESNGNTCGDRARAIAPTYDHNAYSLRTTYYHTLGRQYYIGFNQYLSSLGNPNPTSSDGYFHLPPLHSAVFTCRTSDKLCKF